MRYVAIKGLDRGGTNAFLSLFHCHPEFFSLSEKVQGNIKKIPIEQLFDHSMFKGLDGHLKDLNKIRHIVFKMPRDTKFTGTVFKYQYHKCAYDKIIYLIRNPFRVFISHQNYNKRHNIKRTWDYWNSIMNQTLEHVREYKSSNKLTTRLVVYEHFVKNLNKELSKLLQWIDKNAQKMEIDPQMSLRFWHHCGVCNSKLNYNSGYLECSKCQRKILGHGKFNPAIPVKFKRTVQEDLQAYFGNKSNKVNDIRRKFGKTLFDYWFHDAKHSYITIPTEIS